MSSVKGRRRRQSIALWCGIVGVMVIAAAAIAFWVTEGRDDRAEPKRCQTEDGLATIQKPEDWMQRRLVFHDAPLAEVAGEFNRYNKIRRIEVESGALCNDVRIFGKFSADHPESLVGFLQEQHIVSVTRRPGGFLLRERTAEHEEPNVPLKP